MANLELALKRSGELNDVLTSLATDPAIYFEDHGRGRMLAELRKARALAKELDAEIQGMRSAA